MDNNSNSTNAYQKQLVLNSILKALCQQPLNEQSLAEIEEKFLQVYTDEFRHLYAQLTGYLFQIAYQGNSENGNCSEDFSEDCASLRTLEDNIDMYYEEIVTAHPENINYIRGVTKFFDHVSLEMTRLTHIQRLSETTTKTLKSIDPKVNKMVEDTNSVAQQVEVVQKNIENQKLDFIAILGIFSGIVLAFVGGITFSNSTLQGIAGVSIYRLVAMAAICGMVLVDTIYISLSYVSKMVFRENKDLYPSHKALYVINGCFFVILIVVTIFYFVAK